MTAQLEVTEAGLAVAVQDRGRFGFRRLGVPVSGALDPALLALANALAGNDADAAALEVPLVGPTLKLCSGTVRVALAGPIGATVQGAQGSKREVAPWSTVTLAAGESIKIGAAAKLDAASRLAIGYVAFSGGIGVPLMLGSRSTYARAALGGVAGRALAVGDLLPCGDSAGKTADDTRELRGPGAFAHHDGPIRVIAGPQSDHFKSAAMAALTSEPYTVTPDSDRMGMRLSGPKLQHSALGADIASDGVTPGAIQVPADGQPIVLVADCQTVGGYPKIATVIRADLPRLAHCKPGQTVRFAEVTAAEANPARADLAQRIAQWTGAIQTFSPSGRIDEAALYACNLVSGMVRAQALDSAPD